MSKSSRYAQQIIITQAGTVKLWVKQVFELSEVELSKLHSTWISCVEISFKALLVSITAIEAQIDYRANYQPICAMLHTNLQ